MNKDSEVIRILRFPLALLVVLLHAEPTIVGWNPQEMSSENIGANIAGSVMYSLSHILAQIAVPAFFLISGYLFFKKLEKWDKSVWKRKLVSRYWSIVVPYVICIAVFSTKHLISHYTAGDLGAWLSARGGLLNLFWSSEHWIAGHNNIFGQTIMMSGPAAFHLWFLRDLIVAVLLTPIIYILFAMRGGNRRRWSVFWLVMLGILDLSRVQTPVPGLNFSALFYFGFGSFLSLNRIDLHSAFYKFRHILGALFILLYFFLVPLDGSRSQSGTYIMPFENLIGVMCVINLASYCITTKLPAGILYRYEKTSFFMFIIHPFLLAVVWKLLSVSMVRFFGHADITGIEFVNSHPIITMTLFFTKIILAAAMSVLTFQVLTRISPRLSKLVCGR